MINLYKQLEEIDKIEDESTIDELELVMKDSSIMKVYWENREIALTSESTLERKKAKLKCKTIQKNWGAAIPVNRKVKRFATPHGLTGIHISAGSEVGKGCTIFQHVIIGSNTMLDSKNHGFPKIGENVFIGASATIIGNVKIGNNVRIGANCIVTKDVPDNSICVLSGTKVIVKEEPLNNKFLPVEKYKKMVGK